MARELRRENRAELSGLTDRFSAFVAATRWEDVPAAVRHEAKRSIMNHVAAALAGCRDPALDIAIAVYGRFAADTTASLFGRAEKTDCLNAAMLNAMSANAFDFDDTHMPTIIHPSAPVAPALFALAETRGLSGQHFLLAFILGVEIECRLGNAVSPAHYARGWHITSTCGVFGAAAAASKAMTLDALHIGWAIGHASAQSSGLVETLGSMSKSVGVGNAARNGLVSSLLAERGFSGPAMPLEGPHGFLRVMGEDLDTNALTAELGERWEIMANTYKPYPCGVVLNPVIESCLALRHHPRFALADIVRVVITGNPLLRQRTDRPNVIFGREAQVSAQHGVAVALARGKAGLAEFTDAAVADPALHDFGAKLRFIDDTDFAVESAAVTLEMKSGEPLSHRVVVARGSLGAPLSDSDIENKLKNLGNYGAPQVDAGALIDAIWTLDNSDAAGSLMALASGRA